MMARTTMRSADPGMAVGGRTLNAPNPSSHLPARALVFVRIVRPDPRRVCQTAEIVPDTVPLAASISNDAFVDCPGWSDPANQLVSPMGRAGGATLSCWP